MFRPAIHKVRSGLRQAKIVQYGSSQLSRQEVKIRIKLLNGILKRI